MNVPQPVFTGQNKIYFPEVTSTNDFAMEMISKTNPSEGTCIFTDFQTAGRGQIGRYWQSDAGKNILVSYIFYPKMLKISDQYYLNILGGLAVRDLIASYVPSSKIKWPNDIYVNDRKIAGILVQNVLREDRIRATVIGIGINVNQTVFPTDIPNPTSVLTETGKSNDIMNIMALLSARLEFYYMKIQNNSLEFLSTSYLNHLYRYNEWANYCTAEGETFRAKITGIEKNGKMKLTTPEDETRSYDIREVTFLI